MTRIKQKVYAYIIHQGRLLLFRHLDVPEAGIQVHGGTVKPDEDLAAAVIRETQEETGLEDLVIESFLGKQVWNVADGNRDEIHHRHFYHLFYREAPPDQWRHDENHPSDGSPAPIRLEFFWATMPDQIPELIGDQGFMLPILKKQLGYYG